ncbi:MULTISPECIES: hypothetical protein [unclassified Pseudomonas]|uniref:hypothetical protein n=1 Tax=unclassified Pseudomonas TaxID=196821 RepID=UPI000AD632A5|nr:MULTISPECIES: hypothetical protein [unclassified Pseudomonas]
MTPEFSVFGACFHTTKIAALHEGQGMFAPAHQPHFTLALDGADFQVLVFKTPGLLAGEMLS